MCTASARLVLNAFRYIDISAELNREVEQAPYGSAVFRYSGTDVLPRARSPTFYFLNLLSWKLLLTSMKKVDPTSRCGHKSGWSPETSPFGLPGTKQSPRSSPGSPNKSRGHAREMSGDMLHVKYAGIEVSSDGDTTVGLKRRELPSTAKASASRTPANDPA